jgi:hypothetical protein
MVYSKTIKDTKDFINTKMAISMKVFGGKISSMAEESSSFKMDSYMRETFIKARNMEKVFTDGKMEISIMENLLMTKDKELVNTYGMTDLFTEDNGELIG